MTRDEGNPWAGKVWWGFSLPGSCKCSMPSPPSSRSVGVCAHRDMRLSWVLTVLSICLSALATATGSEGKRKLQIGVKKRVDHCPIKSRKGDVLHMHYTVGEGVERLRWVGLLETRKHLGTWFVPLTWWVTKGNSSFDSKSFSIVRHCLLCRVGTSRHD